MLNRIIKTSIAFLLLTAPVFGDVRLDLRVADSPATTQPAMSESLVSVLAVPGHEFYTRFAADGCTVEVSGTVHAMPNGRFHVEIKFESRSASLESVSTTVGLKPGELVELSRLQSGAFAHTTTLTVRSTSK